MGVLRRDDRTVQVPTLGPQLAEDVVHAPRARADRDELLEGAHLVRHVAALERLCRDHEEPLLGELAGGIRARGLDVAGDRGPQRLLRAGRIGRAQERRIDLLEEPMHAESGSMRQRRHDRAAEAFAILQQEEREDRHQQDQRQIR